jgi:hypothetical protein
MTRLPDRRLVLRAGAAVTASAALGAIAGCQTMAGHEPPSPQRCWR